MTPQAWKILTLGLVLLLAGCKTDLYSQLNEAQANQMMALLLYHHIPTDKKLDKQGITLQVEESRFVDAVEVLRQNGLPERKTLAIQDLFPSGQLVSSPEQEAAKLVYLKSQQLQKMLSSMDGVISAEVSVASPPVGSEPQQAPAASAAVFIKYSPEVNLPAYEAEIRNLVRDGIPGLLPEHISLTMQRAQFHYLPDTAASTTPPAAAAVRIAHDGKLLLMIACAALLLLVAVFGSWQWLRQRVSAP